MKKLLFIYNARAGRQAVRQSLADLLDVFAARGYEIVVRPTQGRGDATVCASHSTGYDRVVCCGGDGTLNETLTGLMYLPREERPTLGYIPTGTTNDFARNLNLPKGLVPMAETACGGLTAPCDLGEAEGRYFAYVAAFGLFTDVSYTTSQTAKNLLGHFAYVLEGAGKLNNVPAYHMTVENEAGERAEGDYIYGMVGNTVSVGGLVSFPKDAVHLDDGLFEVLLIRQPKNAKDWQGIITALTTQTVAEGGPVEGFRASRVTFTCGEPVAWTLDGEFGGEREVTTIQNLNRVFTIARGETE